MERQAPDAERHELSMVYDPSSFSGLTRQVLGQLFPHQFASLEPKSDPQEQERMFRRAYRGMKQDIEDIQQIVPAQPQEEIPHRDFRHTTDSQSWLEDALPGTKLALGDEAGALGGKNVKYSIEHGTTGHQTPILEPAGDIGAALGTQRKMFEILNLPTRIHGKAE